MGWIPPLPPVPFRSRSVYRYRKPDRAWLKWMKWIREVKRFLFLQD